MTVMSSPNLASKHRPSNQVVWGACAIVVWLFIPYFLAALLDTRSWLDTLQSGPSPEVLLAMGAKVDAWVAAGHIERLVVSTWLHANPAHLLVNTLWLCVLGLVFRRLGLSASLYFCVWFFAGVGGQAFSFLVQMGPSIGSSGGIYGALGLVSVVLFARTPRRDVRVLVVGTAIAILVVPYAMRVGSDHASHVGGMLTGWVLSLTIDRSKLHRWLSVLAAVLSVSALFAMGFRDGFSAL